jgi:Domain of unknown function (DUF4158)
MPGTFLTDDQRAQYGRYQGDPDPMHLARCFHLDDIDRAHIRRHHGSHHRLGFALQLCTVRYLGAFLADPLDVPAVVVTHLARQLGVRDTSSVPRYLERRDTRWEHAEEIRRQYGYHDFSEQPWHFRLVRWLYSRAWLTNESPMVLFEHAIAWMLQQKVLLPGVTTLERLIVNVQERSTERLWRVLAQAVPVDKQPQLTALLVVPPGRRESLLDRLRKSPSIALQLDCSPPYVA